MPDNPLTSEAEPAAEPTPFPAAADDAALHDVAPPEPATVHEPAPAVVEPPPPAPEPIAEEPPPPEPIAEAPPAPEPELIPPPAPVTHVEEEPEADEEGLAELEAALDEVAEPSNKHWYVVKVQSGREESIKEAIERRVKIEGLEEFFGQIIIPVEKRHGDAQTASASSSERKLYPGYLMAEVEYNDRILYLFRETSGVGDFVGGSVNRPPPPMSPRESRGMMLGPAKAGRRSKESPRQAAGGPRRPRQGQGRHLRRHGGRGQGDHRGQESGARRVDDLRPAGAGRAGILAGGVRLTTCNMMGADEPARRAAAAASFSVCSSQHRSGAS